MRIAAYHYESRRARWWRELKAWARTIWHSGWGVVWFRPDRFSTLEVSLVHSDDGVNWEPIAFSEHDLEYLELQKWNNEMMFAVFAVGTPDRHREVVSPGASLIVSTASLARHRHLLDDPLDKLRKGDG